MNTRFYEYCCCCTIFFFSSLLRLQKTRVLTPLIVVVWGFFHSFSLIGCRNFKSHALKQQHYEWRLKNFVQFRYLFFFQLFSKTPARSRRKAETVKISEALEGSFSFSAIIPANYTEKKPRKIRRKKKEKHKKKGTPSSANIPEPEQRRARVEKKNARIHTTNHHTHEFLAVTRPRPVKTLSGGSPAPLFLSDCSGGRARTIISNGAAALA